MLITPQKLRSQLHIAYFFNSVASVEKIETNVSARSSPLGAVIKYLLASDHKVKPADVM